MTREQLKIISDAYKSIQLGLIEPLKINNAYKLIQNIDGMEVNQRVKIMAINRYMMLSYEECLNALETQEKQQELHDSIGTVENLPQQTHVEKPSIEGEELLEFLTADEKDDLKQPTSGTELQVTREGKVIHRSQPKRQRNTNKTKIVKQ